MTFADYRHHSSSQHHAQMDTGTMTVIVGGIVAILTAIFGGFWNYISGRKKQETDTQVTVISGFISLITQSEARIERLERRNAELEDDNQKQGRRITQLERLLSRNNIDIPEDGTP